MRKTVKITHQLQESEQHQWKGSQKEKEQSIKYNLRQTVKVTHVLYMRIRTPMEGSQKERTTNKMQYETNS